MPRRYLLHLDLDEFIAAVERLRHPELEGRPIVVGGDGDPTKRGVVSTASYEARVFGIRSAMPLRTAYKRNPDAIFLAVDADVYLETSRRVMDTLRTFDAEVEMEQVAPGHGASIANGVVKVTRPNRTVTRTFS